MQLLPRVVTRNWQLKLSALAMSVLLWTVPRFEAQDTHVFQDVPVRIDLRDHRWALVGEPQPSTVDVTVSGTARELLALSLERPPVLIPIDSATEGETSLLLRPSWFRLPPGEAVVVEEMVPGAVRLAFEPIEIKTVMLAARLTGSLPEGLSQSGPPVVDPPGAQVTGPASQLAELDTVPLRPLDLSRVIGSRGFTQPVDTMGLPDQVSINPTEAIVQIQLEQTVRREFPDLPVEIPSLEPAIPLQVRPARVTVTLVGARSLVEGVDPGDLRVTFPLAQALSLAPGQEGQVFLTVEGIPALLERDHDVNPPWVLLSRPAGL